MMELTTDQLCIILAVNAIIAVFAIIGMAFYLKEGGDE